MEYYVTLFDGLFLPQGLALHASMERHAGPYTLWVLCVDDTAHEVLQRLNLPNLKTLRLQDVETDALSRVKADRTRGEYCWTLTPFSPKFVMDREPTARRVTYIDADLWFRRSPSAIFEEFDASGAKVLITDHGYAPQYDQSATSGQYCVQFMTFERDGGEPVRQWWADRCIEWCYARVERGRFGDQKYLDDWPDRFKGLVHVLQQRDLTLAPWNATRYPYGRAVFYHFQGLRILPSRRIDLAPGYELPEPLIQNVYDPYLVDLKRTIAQIEALGFSVPAQGKSPGWLKLARRTLGSVRRQLWRFRQPGIRGY